MSPAHEDIDNADSAPSPAATSPSATSHSATPQSARSDSDVSTSLGRRLAHDLENDLAAIRIRADVLLQTLSRELATSQPLLLSDIEQMRDAAQHAAEKALALARWLAENDVVTNDAERDAHV